MNNPTSLTTPGDAKTVWLPDKNTPALSGEDAINAISELNATEFTVKFPMKDRNYADPQIMNQTIGLVSFMPAKGATPNKKGIYGFAKLRGNYGTEMEANDRAEMIIKEVDSTHIVYHAYVGRPFPLTRSKKYAADTSEVDIRKDTTESVSAAIKTQKKEDQQKMEEIKDRERELMEDVEGDKPQEEIDLDEYITLNVKRAQLSWTYLEHCKKLKEIKKIIIDSRTQIDSLDKDKPEFKKAFYEKYITARGKSGLTTDLTEDQKQDGFLRYLVQDVELPGIDDGVESFIDTIMTTETPDGNLVSVVEIEKKDEEETEDNNSKKSA